MAEFTLGVFPSLVGSMSLDFSFKLAEAAIAKGHKVNLWLSGNAVMMAKKGQKAFKDYSHNEKLMKEHMNVKFPETSNQFLAVTLKENNANRTVEERRRGLQQYIMDLALIPSKELGVIFSTRILRSG